MRNTSLDYKMMESTSTTSSVVDEKKFIDILKNLISTILDSPLEMQKEEIKDSIRESKNYMPSFFKLVKVSIQFILIIGTVGQLGFEKFTWDQLKDFSFGKAATFDENIPTEGFLDHLGIHNNIIEIFTYCVIGTLLVGDTIANYFTVSPFSDLDETVDTVFNHDPLSDQQWHQLQQNIANSSWRKYLLDGLIFRVLPPLTACLSFLTGSFGDPDGVRSAFNNSRATRILGWPLLAGAFAYYIVLYGPYLAQHIRRFRYAFYDPEFSFLKSIRLNKHLSFEISYQFLIINALRSAMFMFMADTALTDLPDMGIPINYSLQLSLNMQWGALGVTAYTILFSRFFAVKDALIAKNIEEFKNFQSKYSLKSGSSVLWNKVGNFVQSFSRGFFPGWATAYFLNYLTSNYSQLPDSISILISGLGGAIIGGTFMWSHHKSLSQQYMIQALGINKKIAQLLSKLGNNLQYNFLTASCDILGQQIKIMNDYEKICSTNKKIVSQDFLNLKKLVIKNFETFKELKLSFETLFDLVIKFKGLIDENHSTLDEKTQEAFSLYMRYATAHKLSTSRLANVLATITNLSTNTVRQILLIHFCIVLAVVRFGASANEQNLAMLYNHALVFAGSSGLLLFINNLSVYQAPLEKRYNWLIETLNCNHNKKIKLPLLAEGEQNILEEMVLNSESKSIDQIEGQFVDYTSKLSQLKQDDGIPFQFLKKITLPRTGDKPQDTASLSLNST